jgi:hypothetical protein
MPALGLFSLSFFRKQISCKIVLMPTSRNNDYRAVRIVITPGFFTSVKSRTIPILLLLSEPFRASLLSILDWIVDYSEMKTFASDRPTDPSGPESPARFPSVLPDGGAHSSRGQEIHWRAFPHNI